MNDIIIEIRNDRSSIKGDKAGEVIVKLRIFLSVRDSAAAKFSKSGWDGVTYFISKKGEFQNGFLEDVKTFLNGEGYNIKLVNLATRKVSFDLNKLQEIKHLDFELANHQVEALKSLANTSIGTFDHATASGKTFLMASIIDSLLYDPKILLLVHDTYLFNQHINFFSKYWEVGYVNGKKFKEGKVVVAKYKSIINRVDECNENMINWLEGCSCVFVDECHKVAGNDYYNFLSQLPIHSKFLFSGTPYALDSDKARMRVRAIGGQVLHTVSVSDLTKVDWVANIKVHLYNCSDLNLFYLKYPEIYSQSIMYNTQRLSIIEKVVSQSIDENIIITVDRVDHLEFIFNSLQFVNGIKLFKLKGGDNSSEIVSEFSNKPSGFTRVLVTTILQEGANLTLNGLIYAQGGRSEVQLKQYIGRILRKSGGNEKWVVDFFDSTSHVKSHSLARIRTYRNEGYDIIPQYPTKSVNFIPEVLTCNLK